MKRLFAITVFFAAISVQAQELTFWQKVNKLLTTFPNIDSTYIYQPKQSFTLGMFSTVQQAGFDTRANFDIRNEDGTTTSGTSHYSLLEQPSMKLGLELGYGKFVLGYGIEVGPKSAYKKRALGLNLLGKSWGLHFNYFKVSNTFQSGIKIGYPEDENYCEDWMVSTNPAMLKYFSLDGYYVFNNKKFAYPAAYKAGLVQRKTAGSWMVTGRYMQGLIYNTPDPSVVYDYYNLLDCLSTLQFSVGGGYSVNFVCWHKDPVQLRDKGLRNLTINLTLLPVITAISYLDITTYEFNENNDYYGEHTSKTFCYPMPNFIGGSAIALTLDRFFISTQFVYDWFYFHSSQAIKHDSFLVSPELENLTLLGSIHNWKVKLLFTYKF
jgi:hypothetical protein